MISRRPEKVEHALTLNVDQLLKAGPFRCGSQASGRLSWSYPSGRVASVDFTLRLEIEKGCLQLDFTMIDGAGASAGTMTQRIALTTTRMHFGGRRWWFLCPISGERVGRLHLPPGASQFASRRAYDLTYACQSEGRYDRAARRARTLRARLSIEPGLPWLASKPKGMRWTTYARYAERIKAFEATADAQFVKTVKRKLRLI